LIFPSSTNQNLLPIPTLRRRKENVSPKIRRDRPIQGKVISKADRTDLDKADKIVLRVRVETTRAETEAEITRTEAAIIITAAETTVASV